MDWRGVIERSDLGEGVRALIGRVVVRTRLPAIERADVARELVAHFADARESGRDEGEAIERFGDEGQASKLIRRAVKRRRTGVHRMWLWTKRVAIGSVLLVVAVYGWSALGFFFDAPKVERNFVAELNAMMPEPGPEGGAWSVYRGVYLAGPPRSELPEAWGELDVGGEGWDDCVAYWESRQGELGTLREATGYAALGYELTDVRDAELMLHDDPEAAVETLGPPSDNPMLIGVLLEPLGVMRGHLRLLAFDSLMAAQEGDGARVVANTEAAMGLARQSRQMPFLIADLVHIAMVAHTSETVGRIVHRYPEALTDADLEALARALDTATDAGLRVRFDSERMFMLDVIQRAYSDDGNGNGRLTKDGVDLLAKLVSDLDWATSEGAHPAAHAVGPFTRLAIADRKSLTDLHTRYMDEMERISTMPLWERGDEMAELDMQSEMLNFRYWPLKMLLPALSRATTSSESASMRRDGVRIAVALERCRRETGAYPAALSALVPVYLPSVPVDRFVGEPLRYVLTEGGPIVYGVGQDLDDDGGVRTLDTKVSQWRSPEKVAGMKQGSRDLPDADWVLWPVEQRD